MIDEYYKIHSERGLRVIEMEDPKVFGLKNKLYLENPAKDQTTCFVVYKDNPFPARVCIEDLPRRFFTCIGIFEPVYYFHAIYRGVFTKEQKEKLNNFMNSKFKYGNCYNKWRYLVDAWEMAMGENDLAIPKHSLEVPDYTSLPDLELDHPAMFNLQIKYK